MFRGVGQGVRPCRIGYASSFVFVCSSCLWFQPPAQSRSRGVTESRSGRPRADRDRRARATGRKLAEGSPTSRTYRLQNRENKARMSMKTKDKYKKSLSRTVPDQTPTARPWAAGRKVAEGSPTSRHLSSSAARSTEQSENVYENKGSVRRDKPAGSRECKFLTRKD